MTVAAAPRQRSPEEEHRVDRFTRQWEPDHFGRCWEWRGHIEANGYGKFYWSRARGVLWAHRASWELLFGPIPNGMDVCHTCDNRRCIRPGHLFIGTRADNMADAAAKGRTTIGERNPSAKLTSADVLAIRAEYEAGDVFMREIAARYGVSSSAVRGIIHRRRWAHV